MSPECERTREALDALMDGTLSPQATEEVRRHLEVCSECRAEEAWRTDLRQGLRALASEQVPPELAGRIHRRLLRAAPGRRWYRRPWALAAISAVAGFSVAVIGATPLVRIPAPSAAPTAAYTGTESATSTASTPRSSVAGSSITAAPKFATALNHPLVSSASTGSGVVASSAVSADMSPVPRALSLTLLAPSPAHAIGGLAVDAAAAGGQVVATWLPPGSGTGLVPAATLDVVVPQSAAASLFANAGDFGHVLAATGNTATSTGGPERVLITVLRQPATSPSPGPRSALTRSWWTFAGIVRELLREGAYALPWVGGLVVLGAVVAGIRRWRRVSH